MSELKVLKVREKLVDLCDFTEKIIKNTDLIYKEGLSQDIALHEITEIRNQIQSSKKFTIAFVGEYNAGKTSLINLLTGKDFTVSSTVATQTATEIQWKDSLTIVDTPGLGSGLTEHDEITNQWLIKADLLIYVLTADLFNRHSGERFLTMLDKYKRDHELMLVMNMIDQEGNEIDVYRDELQSAIAPKLLDEFFPTFISAKYKEFSTKNTFNDEERAYYLEKSRFDSFLKILNNFIMDRKEKASLTTPLTQINSLLHKIGFKNKFDQENALLDWKIRVYGEHIGTLKSVFGDFQSRLKDYSLGTAGEIFRTLDNPPSNFQEFCEEKFDDFSSHIQNLIENLTDRISSITEELEKEGDKIDRSDLAKEVDFRIESSDVLKKLFNIVESGADKEDRIMNDPIFQEIISRARQIDSEAVTLSGDVITSLCSSKNIFQVGSKVLSKVDKGIVKNIGHFFGKKFKPWEAVKLTSKIAKAAPILNIVGIGVEIYSANKDKRKKEEANLQLAQFKNEIRKILDDAVTQTIDDVSQKLLKPLYTILGDTHKLLQHKKCELIEYSIGNENFCKKLEAKKQECLGLYDDIYGT